jgi:hypothetical protein
MKQNKCIERNINQISGNSGEMEKKLKTKIIINENKKGPGIENMPFTIIIH